MFKITKTRKFIGNMATITMLCLALTACGTKTDKVTETSSTETVVEETQDQSFEMPNIHDYSGSSLNDALSFNGYPATHEYKVKLANYIGYNGYNDTDLQNAQLLDTLKEYSAYANSDLVNETVATTEAATTEAATTEADVTWSGWKYYNENQDYRTSSTGEIECLDHDYGEWVSNGSDSVKSTCSRCKNVITKDLGHNFGSWTARDSEKEMKSCTRCGQVETRDHTYGSWTYLNDTQEGRACSTCGYVDTRSHTFGDTYLSVTADKEVSSKTCQTCDYTVVNETAISGTKYVEPRKPEKAKHEHDFDEDVRYVSTDGEAHYKQTVVRCNDCGKEIDHDEEIEDCTFSKWKYNESTEQYERTCKYCGKTVYTKNKEEAVNPRQKSLR